MVGREIVITAVEHASAAEALQHLEVSGHDKAILVGGKYLTMTTAVAEQLEAFGAAFAYLAYREPTGQIVTIPVDGRAS